MNGTIKNKSDHLMAKIQGAKEPDHKREEDLRGEQKLLKMKMIAHV